jgi:hypothetical protein
VLVGLFPGLLSGPFADVGPLARSIVLPVNYAYSLATEFDRFQFVAGPAAALPAFVYLSLAARKPEQFVWAATQIILLAGLFLACFVSGRIALYLMVAAIPAWAVLLCLAGRRLWALAPPATAPLAVAAVVVLAFWPYGVPALLYGPERITWGQPRENQSCRYNELAPVLDHLRPNRNGLVATYIFDGPQVAFETGRPVITGPYTRSEASLKDYRDFFYGPPETARRVARTLGIETVVLCRRSIFFMALKTAAPGSRAPGSIMRGLTQRRYPTFLQPLRLPPYLAARHRVFLVDSRSP